MADRCVFMAGSVSGAPRLKNTGSEQVFRREEVGLEQRR